LKIYKTAFTDRLDGQSDGPTGKQNVGEGFLYTSEPLYQHARVLDAKTTRYVDATVGNGSAVREIEVPSDWTVTVSSTGYAIERKATALGTGELESISFEALYERGL
jgi:hypothetical protein